MMLELDTIHCMDCFDLMAQCDDQSVDAIICDLPYGTTACAWDSIIPFEPLWAAFKRVIKPRGAIVLTASQPFTSALVMSNPAWFRYAWVWDKKYHSNPFLASKQPLRRTEDILVFGVNSPEYRPQIKARPREWMREKPSYEHKNGAIFGNATTKHPNSSTRDWVYPDNILVFPLDPPIARDTSHPTQKPIDLFAYLIRTYTRPSELVLDPTCGSGTTAIAARNEGRHFICGDSDPGYVQIARDRLAAPYTVPMFVEPPPDDKPTQTGFLGDTPK